MYFSAVSFYETETTLQPRNLQKMSSLTAVNKMYLGAAPYLPFLAGTARFNCRLVREAPQAGYSNSLDPDLPMNSVLVDIAF